MAGRNPCRVMCTLPSLTRSNTATSRLKSAQQLLHQRSQATCHPLLRQPHAPTLKPRYIRQFSTTHPKSKGKPGRDLNRNRGVSAIRATGLRYPLSVSKYPLPKPVLDPELRDKVQGTSDHGLWAFFNEDKTRFRSPDKEVAFGRPWTVHELRPKSWEDLHGLWWVCCLERNRIATTLRETKRTKIHFGSPELIYRDIKIRETQEAIQKTLKERWFAWERARSLALEDPTVDLSGDGPAFQPFMEAQEEGVRDSNATVEI